MHPLLVDTQTLAYGFAKRSGKSAEAGQPRFPFRSPRANAGTYSHIQPPDFPLPPSPALYRHPAPESAPEAKTSWRVRWRRREGRVYVCECAGRQEVSLSWADDVHAACVSREREREGESVCGCARWREGELGCAKLICDHVLATPADFREHLTGAYSKRARAYSGSKRTRGKVAVRSEMRGLSKWPSVKRTASSLCS